MAEDFLPVGIKAVVVGVDKFLGDLRRMQTGVTQFAQHVKNAGIDVRTLGSATATATAQSKAFGSQAKILAQNTRLFNSTVVQLVNSVSSLGSRMGAAAPRAQAFSASITSAQKASNQAAGSVNTFVNSITAGINKLHTGNRIYQEQAIRIQQLEEKHRKASVGVTQFARSVDRAAARTAAAKMNYQQASGALQNSIKVRNGAKKALDAYRLGLVSLLRSGKAGREEIIRRAGTLKELQAEYKATSGAVTVNIAKEKAAHQTWKAGSAQLAGMQAHLARGKATLAAWGKEIKNKQTVLKAFNAQAALLVVGVKSIGFAIKASIGVLKLFKKAVTGVINVVKKLNGLWKSAVGKVKSFTNSIKNVGSRAFRAGNSIRFLGTSITFLVTLPIAGFLKKMTTSALDFEEAWAGVLRTVDDPALGDMYTLLPKGENDIKNLTAVGENLRQGFRDLALQIPVSAAELANLGEVAGTLGVRGNQNMLTFVETAARLGVTTNVSAEEAATSLAKIVGVAGGLSDAELALAGYSEETLESITASERFQASAEALGGVLVDLGNKTRAQEDEILNFATKIAATGNIIGLTSVEMIAISTAFQAVGVDTARGGTAFQKTIVTMLKAVQEGGKELEIFAATAGETVEEFSTLFEDDASEAIRQFVEGLGQSGDQAIGILTELDLSDARVMQSILALASAEGELTNALNIANGELMAQAGAMNALQTESERRFSSTQNQLKLLKNQYEDLGITIGDFLLPKINDLVKQARRVIEVFTNLSDDTKKFILTTLGIVALAGPVITALGLFLASLGFIVTAIASVIGAVLSLIGVLGLLALPVVAVVAALVGLAVALAASFKKMDTVATKTSEGLIQKLFAFGRNIIISFAQGMASALIAIVTVLNEIGKIISTWLRPGSPPKITPDLDKWGAGAMQSYIDGWLKADFGVFNKLSNKLEGFIRSMSNAKDAAGKRTVIEAIIGTRAALSKATDELKRLGKISKKTMDGIFKAMGRTSAQVRRYIKAIVEVKIATEQMARAQAEVNRITDEYEAALKPIEKRLKQINDRQQEVADSMRIMELEEILADPRAPELVRELAKLELEEISLTADSSALETAKDSQLELVESELSAAEARLDAAQAELGVAEAALDVTTKNADLLKELANIADETAKKIKDSLDIGDISGFEEIEIPDFDEEGGLLDSLVGDLGLASIADTITDSFGDLVGEIQKIFEPVGAMWDNLGTTWAPILDGIYLDVVEPFISSLRGFGEGGFAVAAVSFGRDVAKFIKEPLLEVLNLLIDLGIIPESIKLGPIQREMQGVQEEYTKLAERYNYLVEQGEQGKFVDEEEMSYLKRELDSVGAKFGEVSQEYAAMEASLEGPQSRLGKGIQNVKDWFSETGETIKNFAETSPIIQFITSLGKSIGKTLGPSFKKFGKVFSEAGEKLGGAFEKISEVIKKHGPEIKAVLQGIGLFITGVVTVAVGIITGIINVVIGVVQNLIGIITTIITGAINVISGVIDFIMGLFEVFAGVIAVIVGLIKGDMDIVSRAWEGIKKGAESMVSGVIGIFTGLWNALKGIMNGIFDTLIGVAIDLWNGVVGFFTNLYNDLVGNSIITDMWERAKEIFSNAIDAIVGFLGGLITEVILWGYRLLVKIKKPFQDAWNWLIEKATEAFNSAVTFFTGFIDGIKEFIDDPLGFIEDMWEDIKTFFGGLPDKAMQFGKDIINGLTDGLKELAGDPVGFITGLGSDLLDGVKGALGIGSPSKEFAEVGEEIMKGWVDGIEDQKRALLKIIEEMGEELVDETKDMASNVVKVWDRFGEAARALHLARHKIALGLFDGFADAHLRSVKDHLTSVLKAFGIFENALTTVLIRFYKDRLDEFKLLIKRMNEHLIGMRKAFRASGHNLMDSLRQGLEDGRAAVLATARSIADAVRDVMNEANEISSPSKLFYEMGGYLMEGLNLGMLSQASSILDSAAGMLSPLAGLARSKLELLQAGAAPMPVYAPAASPAQVVTNVNNNFDMGGQNINNGMGAIEFQLLLEQALRNAI